MGPKTPYNGILCFQIESSAKKARIKMAKLYPTTEL